jgi:hypothetical protein
MFTAMDDPIIQRIERFRCSRATLCAERRNRGYTLYSAQSGALVARLRPTKCNDRFEGTLLVALEKPMDLDRPVWTHRLVDRGRARLHRI